MCYRLAICHSVSFDDVYKVLWIGLYATVCHLMTCTRCYGLGGYMPQGVSFDDVYKVLWIGRLYAPGCVI